MGLRFQLFLSQQPANHRRSGLPRPRHFGAQPGRRGWLEQQGNPPPSRADDIAGAGGGRCRAQGATVGRAGVGHRSPPIPIITNLPRPKPN